MFRGREDLVKCCSEDGALWVMQGVRRSASCQLSDAGMSF